MKKRKNQKSKTNIMNKFVVYLKLAETVAKTVFWFALSADAVILLLWLINKHAQ